VADDAVGELTVYRMVQEALTNIGKYARPRQGDVDVQRTTYHAEVIRVVDDGVGFDPARACRRPATAWWACATGSGG
jgi:signal transduction histidine kinase